MTKKPKGRPRELAKEQRNADRVFLRLARDRDLAKLPAKFGKTDGRPEEEMIQNLLSGKNAKGQQRSPRALGKVVLPEVAAEIRALPDEEQEKLSARTLERHYAKHGKGSPDRIVSEFTERLRQRDKERVAIAKAKAEPERSLIEKLNRIARATQRQGLRKVFRKK